MPTRRQMLFTAAAAATLGVTATSNRTFGASPYTPWLDKRMTLHLQRVLALSDDDWSAVAPRLDPVLHLLYERDRFGRVKLPKPSRSDTPPDASTGGNIVAIKNDASRQADPGTPTAMMADHYFQLIAVATESGPPTAEIKQALNDYRLARARSDAELAKARASLRELMDLKQEAVLVVMGILD